MTAALLTSLALAMAFTPALAISMLREKKADEPNAQSRRSRPGDDQDPQCPRDACLRGLSSTSRAIGVLSVVLLSATYVFYAGVGPIKGLPNNQLPSMDEGSFIVDYIMPAGSSLSQTDASLAKVEKILAETPEVSITTRRTGMQLGLAAVTEANTGDISVRLKTKRKRAIEAIIEDVRDKIKDEAPELDVEFVQVLEDMINDLSNSPEPIQIKLFSTDEKQLLGLGPKVMDAIAKIPGITDTQNGVDNTLSGPATNFVVNPSVASRLGFTVQEVAEDATSLMDGLATTDPVIVNGRPYTVRIRMDDESSQLPLRHSEHRLQLHHRTHRDTWRAG